MESGVKKYSFLLIKLLYLEWILCTDLYCARFSSSFILSLHALPTLTLTPEWEVGALEDLYHATHDGGRGRVRQDNWLTGDPCSDSRYGVYCKLQLREEEPTEGAMM
tara:strand:- start:209 stop:529 length:321 start_codon:yes stop_codon:yes gene_type:complete